MRRWIGLAAPAALACFSVACSHPPSPNDVLQEYLSDWQKQDFQGMYTLLSAKVQKQISKNDFVSRYKSIEEGIGTTGLTLKAVVPKDSQNNGDKPVTITVQGRWSTSTAGSFQETYHVRLVKDKDGWRVDWTPALIFPQLKSGWQVRAVSEPAERGEILDRNGKPLAENAAAKQIGLVPGKQKPDSAKQLAKVLGIDVAQVEADLKQSWVKPDLFVPVRTLPDSEEKQLEKRLLAIPGVEIVDASHPVRTYPLGAAAAHLTGYVGPITADELTPAKKRAGYTASDVIGQQGLERSLESELRGQPGGRIWVTDASGKQAVTIAQKAPVAGKNVELTIDANVQKALNKALAGQVGSAVVLNPNTGAVLALASQPGFNPNELARGVSSAAWKKMVQAKDPPFVDRALSAVPPGSTLKPLVAAAALDAGAIRPDTTFPGTNHLKWQKDKSWGNHYVHRVPHPSGTVNLERALVWSDNIYFAQVGLALGKEKFVNGMERFGFGKTFTFPLAVGASQVANHENITSEEQLADSAYGQGQVLVSPLQLASMYTAFWNQGNVMRPYLVQRVTDATGNTVQQTKPVVFAAHVMSDKTRKILVSDLRQVVADSTGTAHAAAALPGWTVAGKTGTAEKKAGGDEWGWFAATATRKGDTKPTYLIVMALDHTQHEQGSHAAVHRVVDFLKALPR
ncbi:penicillin-binding transpeptidase domain-containing protein [Alicyclobacillus herbarius]|uniref:penicillin-binding transpeptidase domain-containing protein n=1 Tax=Alicyclobacillus herbarius TaxID=122960 RepID=UPI0003F7ADAF|nr:penicillin-binding transpeptidase domain-containing protein [Alicyclobacillus herbarius]